MKNDNFIVGYVGGVIVPLAIIYLMEGIGIFHFENKLLPAIVIVLGSIALIVLTEATKIIRKIMLSDKD